MISAAYWHIPKQPEDENRNQNAIPDKAQVIEMRVLDFGSIGDRMGGEQCNLSALYKTINGKRHTARVYQQDNGDDRTHLEILLSYDLFVDVDGEHIVLTADDLW